MNWRALAVVGGLLALERVSRSRGNGKQLPLPFPDLPPKGWPHDWRHVVQSDFDPQWAVNLVKWTSEPLPEKLRARTEELARALTVDFLRDYEQQPWRNLPGPPCAWDINCGDCEDFAVELERALENLVGRAGLPTYGLCSLEELAEVAAYLGDPPPLVHPQDYCHVLFRAGDHFFDSQNPEGVRDWRDLQVARLVSREEHLRLLRESRKVPG